MIDEMNRTANKVGNAVAGVSGVLAVAVYGSLAEGYADKHSDINLIAVCADIPKLEKRREKLEKNFEWIVFKNDTLPKWRTAAQDFFFADGRNITVLYKQKKELEFISGQIKSESHINRQLFREAVSYIHNTKIVKDQKKVFAKLRKNIPPASPKLLEYFLPDLEHLSLENGWPYSSLQQAIVRGNFLYVDQIINLELEDFLICLHAINNRHYTSPKWAMRSVRSLRLKPQATLPRIQKISKLGNSLTDLRRKINLLQSLVSDLNKLILKEKIFTF